MGSQGTPPTGVRDRHEGVPQTRDESSQAYEMLLQQYSHMTDQNATSMRLVPRPTIYNPPEAVSGGMKADPTRPLALQPMGTGYHHEPPGNASYINQHNFGVAPNIGGFPTHAMTSAPYSFPSFDFLAVPPSFTTHTPQTAPSVGNRGKSRIKKCLFRFEDLLRDASIVHSACSTSLKGCCKTTSIHSTNSGSHPRTDIAWILFGPTAV